MFSKMKDKALSKGLVMAVNHQIKEFGEMLKFNLDSKSKTIELEIMLEGEKESLHVKVNSYKLTEENRKHYLVANDIVTSRAWINSVASQYLSGQKFEIPAEYAKMLKLVA
jgi:hypothetical protein